VVEGVLGPLDVTRLSLDERDVRSGRLEVEEVLRIDLREALRLPDLGEVPTGERGSLAAVVPPAKGGDQERLTERRALGDVEFVSDSRSLRSA
jgi:hypothetical protein